MKIGEWVVYVVSETEFLKGQVIQTSPLLVRVTLPSKDPIDPIVRRIFPEDQRGRLSSLTDILITDPPIGQEPGHVF